MKYKLVKKYPGSPNIGDTAELDIELGDFRVSNNYFQPISKKQIINYPEFWEEVKEPLFVTEDGVDVFKYDYFYYVSKYGICYKGYARELSATNKEFKYFSTPEAAKKYIEQNKPRFSVKDIEEALLSAKEEKHSIIEDEGFIILSKFNEKKFKQKLGI